MIFEQNMPTSSMFSQNGPRNYELYVGNTAFPHPPFLGGIVFVLLRLEEGLKQLLEPL
jgi:hypothetical protein